MCEHIAIITETKSTYIMIKSTLQLDDRSCTRPFLISPGTSKDMYVVKKTGVGDSLGTRLTPV